MKKVLLPLIVLMFLFISVSPASAKSGPPPYCTYYIKGDVVGIHAIDPLLRYIEVPYKVCYLILDTYIYYKWLAITERTRIKYSDQAGMLTFDDLSDEQSIKYAFYTDELGQTIATAITIYPE